MSDEQTVDAGHIRDVERIRQVDLQKEMQRSYLDYAMSVIVGRALPDVRDGLKPVHRRILYAMYDGGYRPTSSFSKSSRIVGDVSRSHRASSVTSWVTTIPTATQRSTMHLRAWCSPGRCATPWSPVRVTSVPPVTWAPQHLVTPNVRWPLWPWKWSATSTKNALISRTTMMGNGPRHRRRMR